MVFYQTAPKSALQDRLTAEHTGWDGEPVGLEDDLAPESQPAMPDELLDGMRSAEAPERPAFMVDLMEAWSQP